MSSPYPSRAAARASRQKPPRRSAGRVFLQILGELLLTIGIVLLLYVFWQLQWTTMQVQGGMHERVAEFQLQHPSTPEPSCSATQRTDDPPEVSEPSYGEVFGVLHVKKWGMQIPIAQGTGNDVIDNGDAGHYEYSQLPGQIGNFAIAGHRRSYGNNFRRVDIMQPGDPIVVETDSAWLVYEVTDHEIVLPTQTEVILPVPNEPGVAPTQRIMTMTTCHPEFGNTHRFILRSEMKYWVPKDEGMPQVLCDGTGS